MIAFLGLVLVVLVMGPFRNAGLPPDHPAVIKGAQKIARKRAARGPEYQKFEEILGAIFLGFIALCFIGFFLFCIFAPAFGYV